MTEEQILFLLAIFFSMLIGFIIGSLACLYVMKNDTKELENELDKFRELYFDLLDRWKNNYTNYGNNKRTN
mgnify:CR=1 FL=1|tara:strand:+ start:602 stop:814 length:213 start_codon:yes stop_codon:yes gene_type:complete